MNNLEMILSGDEIFGGRDEGLDLSLVICAKGHQRCRDGGGTSVWEFDKNAATSISNHIL
jgi:hypothetical protein